QEGRCRVRRSAITPPAGVRSDMEVLHGLAVRLDDGRGRHRGFPCDPEEVFEELRRASAGGAAAYSGITYGRLEREQGVFWPCPAPAGRASGADHPGTPRLFLDRFATAGGRGGFVAVRHRPAAGEADHDPPGLPATGRVAARYQSGALPRRVAERNDAAPGPVVELHPRRAERLGAAEGDPLAVVSRRGR